MMTRPTTAGIGRQSALRLSVVLLALCWWSTSAAAQKRVALIVGNASYAHVPSLANPQNDAGDVAAAMGPLGFEVISGVNVTRARFSELLGQLGTALKPGDEALFFYAGHGMQAKGVNYLVPVDAQIRAEADLDREAVALERVLEQMRQAGTKIVMLDACRNNPFADNLVQSAGSRAISANRGLAVSVASELGTFIAYATQPGNVARDGEGRNSPFTEKLKAHIATPGQSITDLMMVVRNEVAAATDGAQIPWEHSALSRRFHFRAGAEVALDARGQKASEAAEAWGWIRNSANPAVLDEFIRRFPDTPFASQARSTLAGLKAKPDVVATAIPNIKTMSLRQVQPSFDCKVHYQDAEVAICNTAELSILDNEISRLYVAALADQSQTRRNALAAEQRAWIEARNACGTNVACLTAAHQRRVSGLARAARARPAALVAKAKPSFDCAEHVLPSEVAVCSDPLLARLDVDLDKRYGALAGRLTDTRRRALGVEQRQWLVARNTCASDPRCLELQYRARIGQIQSWR